MPVDPGRHWLEAGITGIARLREWDAVVTVSAPGVSGDEVEFVALPDGRLVAEGYAQSGFGHLVREQLRNGSIAQHNRNDCERPGLE